MNPPIKLLRAAARHVGRVFNSLGSKRECYVCNRRFSYFTKFGRGSRAIPEFNRRLDVIGSDIDNFGCMYCNSHDRERHLFMFFDKLGLWERMKGAKILHFAPEENLSKRIASNFPLHYVRADLYSNEVGVEKIDATVIPFKDHTFEFVIANHILEHIPDHSAALREFYRVLKPGGVGILQTPYSRLLRNNFEDENINTDELRLFFHGQKDHVRTFGEHGFKNSIERAGFDLQIIRHDDHFDDATTYLYGVNRKEDLIHVEKPFPESQTSPSR